jgi:hypothetical protein
LANHEIGGKHIHLPLIGVSIIQTLKQSKQQLPNNGLCSNHSTLGIEGATSGLNEKKKDHTAGDKARKTIKKFKLSWMLSAAESRPLTCIQQRSVNTRGIPVCAPTIRGGSLFWMSTQNSEKTEKVHQRRDHKQGG